MIGTTVAGRYEIQEQIGIGGMGVVYCAHDATLRRDVAAKFIAPHLVSQAEARERFQREAQAVAGLTHPNIVAVYDFVEEPKSHGAVLIMELLRGTSLRQRMADKNRPPFSDVAIQTCRALETAHGKGILHRDIKPENIFACADGTLKLMDFGLARLLDSNSMQSGMIVGTVSYMAPEQLRGEKLDARTDLYALGVLLYEYLAGVTPFAADNPGAVLLKHLNEPPPSLREKLPTLPAEIEAVVFKLLAKNPDDRYPSAAALREALENPSPGGQTMQIERANAVATLPTVAISAPRPAAPIEPLFPKTGSGGRGPYLIAAQKRRAKVRTAAVSLLLLASIGTAAYIHSTQNISLSVTRKPQQAKAKPHSLAAKPRHTKAAQSSPDETALLAIQVRQEEAALEKERRERAKLQRELAAKPQSSGDTTPGPDIPVPNNDSSSPDNTPPAPIKNSPEIPAPPPSLAALNVTGRAVYLLKTGAIRVNVGFNSDCNVRFYALPAGGGQAVMVGSSFSRLNVSDTGQGNVPVDLTIDNSANPPPLIVMVASRRDLTDLKPSYTVAAASEAARSLRQGVNAVSRGQRNDTVVRVLPVRARNRKNAG